jgi:hypothetical protein
MVIPGPFSIAIRENYYFIDTENCKGAGNMARKRSSKLMGLRARIMLDITPPETSFTYFAMILPGKATLTVQSRPFVGLKRAVGFDVSRGGVAPLTLSLASLLRFRF